jgi:uncharacterized membrane protein
MDYVRSTTRLIAKSFRLQNLGDLAFLIASLVVVLDLIWAGLTGNWGGLFCGVVLWLASLFLLAEYHAALTDADTIHLVEREDR